MVKQVPLPSASRNRRSNPNTSPPEEPARFAFQKQRRDSQSSLNYNYGGIPSSDPPLFSSDDLPFSLENYREGASKRKRTYRGPWWGEEVEPKRKRKHLKKKAALDSGVWMRSDDDVAADNSSPADDASGTGAVNTEIPIRRAHPLSLTTFPSSPAQAPRRRIEPKPKALERAERHILHCLDEGLENVDLSHFAVGSIPTGVLQPLGQLIKLPRYRSVPSSEDTFAPFGAELRLFLSVNFLSSLPADLFQLKNIKELSLRHNELKEIPPAIKKLTTLQQLNIVANRLQYLPWELLELIKTGNLQRLAVRPNPFLVLKSTSNVRLWYSENTEPRLPIAFFSPDYGGEVVPESIRPILVAKGHIQFFDAEGKPTKKSTAPRTADAARVSSLREFSMRTLSRSSLLSQLTDSDLEDCGCPDNVLRLVQKTRTVKESGGRTCNFCSKDFIIHRAEWMEWWDITPHERGLEPRRDRQRLNPLPFLFRTCSWSCALEGAKSETRGPLTRRKSGR